MSSSAPKILLFGSGAIGTIYLYLLLKAGCSVTAVCRSNYTAAKEDGFHIDSVVYGKGIHIKPKVVRTCEEAASDGPYDYVIVSCKALPEVQTSKTIAPVVTAEVTTVVLIQNGIGIEDEYAERFAKCQILSCAAYLPTTQTKPGYISMGAMERLEIGIYKRNDAEEQDTSKADLFVSLLKSAGGNPVYFADIQERRWYKLLLNAPWNPICALTLSRDQAFLESSTASQPVIRGVLDEVIAISKALGYQTVNSEAASQSLSMITARKGTVGIEPSMLVDMLWGRRMEHEVILGNPVRIAKERGVDVPRLEMLYALVKGLDLAVQERKDGKSLDGEDLKRTKMDGGQEIGQ